MQCTKLYVELHNLYYLPDTVQGIKLIRMRWVQHMACMGEEVNAMFFIVQKPERKRKHG
jgi:ribonuclease I